MNGKAKKAIAWSTIVAVAGGIFVMLNSVQKVGGFLEPAFTQNTNMKLLSVAKKHDLDITKVEEKMDRRFDRLEDKLDEMEREQRELLLEVIRRMRESD